MGFKFKIGDKVKILTYDSWRISSIGVVVTMKIVRCNGNPTKEYLITDCHGRQYFFRENKLEVLKEKKMNEQLISLYQEIEKLKKENQMIKDIASALLHLPFSATEAFEKARKELLEVICKK